jgi:glutamyl-tRNA reductase
LLTRLPDLDEATRAEVLHSLRRVADKLLHQPTVRVQELSADPDAVDYAAALRELFALDPQSVAAVMAAEVATS